jgi:hypothetical protein
MFQQEVLETSMVKIIYPRDWERLRLNCLQNANYQCQHCGIKDGTILESKRSKRPYIVYLHAAHQHQDIANKAPQLIALCPRCHMKHDRQQVNGNRRSGYGKLISTENLARAVHSSGLVMWVASDGLHWSINQYQGIASDPLDAVTQALLFLQAVPTAPTGQNQ